MFRILQWTIPLPVIFLLSPPGLAQIRTDFLQSQYPAVPEAEITTPACYIQINTGERLNLENLCNPPEKEADERPTNSTRPCFGLDERGRPCPGN